MLIGKKIKKIKENFIKLLIFNENYLI